jgi:hypothetical protein
VPPGGLLTFSGLVSNAGNATLTNVIVVNDHPTNRTPVFGPITLAPQQSASFSGSYRVCLGCCPPFVDTLTATGAQSCNGSNLTATATAACRGITTPQLSLVVDCPATPPMLGEVFFYSGSVSNAGDVPLSSVLITDNQAGYVAEIPALGLQETVDFFGFYLTTNCGPGVVTLVAASGFDFCTGGSVGHQVSASCPVLCPTAPAPVSLKPGLAGGQFKFTVATELGRTYTVQCTDSLRPMNWLPQTNFPGTGGSVTITDPITHQQRYYRLLVE